MVLILSELFASYIHRFFYPFFVKFYKRGEHKKSKELNKISGGMFKSRKLNKTLLLEFAAINMKGYQAILNSDGEVVPFITGKEIRNSLIDGTYVEYKKQLVDNAEHFDEYKEIYFKKHITAEDNSADEDNDNEEDYKDLNEKESDAQN